MNVFSKKNPYVSRFGMPKGPPFLWQEVRRTESSGEQPFAEKTYLIDVRGLSLDEG